MQCVICDDAVAVTKIELVIGQKIPVCISCFARIAEKWENEKRENRKIKSLKR